MTTPAPAPAPAAAPTPTSTPIVTDALRLVRVLFSPGAVFAELDAQPAFWTPLLLISIPYALLQFLQRPFQQRVAQLMMERLNQPVRPPSTIGAIVSVVAAPIIILVLVAIAAGILYLLVSAMGGQANFKKMMIVVIHTWPLIVLQQALSFVVLSMRGVSSITGPQDMMVSLGLDLVLPSDAQVGTFLRFILVGIGPLQIWSLVITAVGAMVLGRMGKNAAWTAAVIFFVIGLLVAAGLATAGMKMMGG